MVGIVLIYAVLGAFVVAVVGGVVILAAVVVGAVLADLEEGARVCVL